VIWVGEAAALTFLAWFALVIAHMARAEAARRRHPSVPYRCCGLRFESESRYLGHVLDHQ